MGPRSADWALTMQGADVAPVEAGRGARLSVEQEQIGQKSVGFRKIQDLIL
jgi:hypothetical protein